MNEREPSILVDRYNGESTFRIVESIGTTSSRWSDGITIYRAERAEPFLPTPSVAIMYVDKDKDKAIAENLKLQLSKTQSPGGNFHNILAPWHTFSYDHYYCVVFSYMERGSLLSLMAHRFPRGFPEQCILFFLYQTLQALSEIHRRNDVHREVSAAHIFITQTWGRIQAWVGYAGSVHDLLADQLRDSCSSYMPATSVCRWAAAPDMSSDIRADIWSIGITALELAYGGLRLTSRDDLESLVKKIHRKHKLPKTLNDRHPVHGCVKEKRALPFLPVKKRIAPTGFEYRPKERVFSKGFVDLVLTCLDFNPDKRPSATDLLRRKIFTKVRGELDFLL